MRAHGWIVGTGALLAGLAVLALALELAGYDAGPELGALWSGAFGSWYAITSATSEPKGSSMPARSPPPGLAFTPGRCLRRSRSR